MTGHLAMTDDLTDRITRAHEAHTVGRLYGVGDGRTDCVTTVLAVLAEVYRTTPSSVNGRR